MVPEPKLCVEVAYFLSDYVVVVTYAEHLLTFTFMYSVGDAENLGKNTVCRAIHKVAGALTEHVDAFVVFPGHLPTQCIKEGFYDIAGFPRVLGLIDCTHIPISAHLGKNEANVVNRKSFHSLNIQMTRDQMMGSVHNSRLFRESLLCPKVEQGQFSGVLLGDGGYACLPYLLTPYPDPGAGPQRRVNVAHAKTRVRIYMTFGVIKARFSCLRGMRVAPDPACRIISACVVLHYITTMRKERTPTPGCGGPHHC
ncbi:putative nuclease HARBI1 [Antennarius striatus]|uniref:putative nuclease HARBI1 n=1 Tax=Antennarius striatus TaxID=241820 RepID=UPI0035AF363E